MATSGAYTLLINDGPQDEMLRATKLLNARLTEIRKLKSRQHLIDPTPSINDVEKTHLIFMSAHYKPYVATSYEYHTTIASNARFGSTMSFDVNKHGDFFNDMYVHIRISRLVAKNNTNEDNSLNGKVRYSNFLGHKLFSNIKFRINGNLLDSYDSEVMNFNYAFYVTKDKEIGYKRAVGQETPLYGYLNDPIRDIREQVTFFDGLQTPKTIHEAFDMFIPLHFWFNKDPRLSLPVSFLAMAKKIIEIDLAPVNQLICGDEYIEPHIEVATLYTNNIYVNPEIQDIYAKRLTFSLIRVHAKQKNITSDPNGKILLDSIKWPVETIFLCFQPLENINTCDKWDQCGLMQEKEKCVIDVIPAPSPPGEAYKQIVSRGIDYMKCIPIIDTLKIQSFGITLYDMPAGAYNSYIPYTYGSFIVTPYDCGKYMIPFNFYPGSYQPSGHFNFSRSRESYIEYIGALVPNDWDQDDRNPGENIISTKYPARINLVAICLNFLIISDGSAVLKYAT